MAGFLRKKQKAEPPQSRPVQPEAPRTPRAPPHAAANEPIVPPLYARFATVSSSSINSDSKQLRPGVSGPMSLATARKGAAGSPGGGPRGSAGVGSGNRSAANGRHGGPGGPSNSAAVLQSEASVYKSASGMHVQPVGPNTASPRTNFRQNSSDSPMTSNASFERHPNGPDQPRRFMSNTSLSTPVDKPLPMPASLIPISQAPSTSSHANARRSYEDQQLQDDLRMLYNTDSDSAYPDILHPATSDTNYDRNGSTTPKTNHLANIPNEVLSLKSLPPPPPDPAIPASIYTRAPQPQPQSTRPHHTAAPDTRPPTQNQSQAPPQPAKEQASSPPPVKRASFMSRLSLSRGSSSQSDTPARSKTQSKAHAPPSATRDAARAGSASLDGHSHNHNNAEDQWGRSAQPLAIDVPHPRAPSSPPVSSPTRPHNAPSRAASVASSTTSSVRRASAQQTTFGDFWMLPLPPSGSTSRPGQAPRRSASSAEGPPHPHTRQHVRSSTTTESPTTHSSQPSPAFVSAQPQSTPGPVERQQSPPLHPIPPPAPSGQSPVVRQPSPPFAHQTHTPAPTPAQPPSRAQPPPTPTASSTSSPPPPSPHHEPLSQPQQRPLSTSESPPAIADAEFKAYTQIIKDQGRPSPSPSPVPDPAQMNYPHNQPQAYGPYPSYGYGEPAAHAPAPAPEQMPQIGHARRTSVHARKGPLIFNGTADETEGRGKRSSGGGGAQAQVSRSPERHTLTSVPESIKASGSGESVSMHMQAARAPDASYPQTQTQMRAYPSPPAESVPIPHNQNQNTGTPRKQPHRPMSSEFESPVSAQWGANVPSRGSTPQEAHTHGPGESNNASARALPPMPAPQRRSQAQAETDPRLRSHHNAQPHTYPPRLPPGTVQPQADPRLRQSALQAPAHMHAEHDAPPVPPIPVLDRSSSAAATGQSKPRRFLTKVRHGTAPAPAPAPTARPVTPPASPKKAAFAAIAPARPDDAHRENRRSGVGNGNGGEQRLSRGEQLHSDDRQNRRSGVGNGNGNGNVGEQRLSRGEQLQYDDRQNRHSGVGDGADQRLSRGEQPQDQARRSPLPELPGTRLSQPDMSGVDPLATKRRTRPSVNLDENAPAPPPKRTSQHDMNTPDAPATTRRSRASANLDHKNPTPRAPMPPLPVAPESRTVDASHSDSGPQIPGPPDSILQQSATAGPYDPVTPRPRSRPMTIFSMTAFSLTGILSDAGLLFCFLNYLTFADWIALWSTSKHFRKQLEQDKDLREEVLERYLDTIGYERWAWDQGEPLQLTLKDINNYMRGVSMPNHQYARLADQCLRNPGPRSTDIMRDCSVVNLAYSRVVVRLRAQAEAAEAEYIAKHIPGAPFTNPPVTVQRNGTTRSRSRPSSRAPSPSQHAPASAPQFGSPFRSPLFKLRRAPMLRVFVPSPDGDWLSDTSVLECEAQLQRAGVTKLLRAGDVIWDIAVGDEGNIGKLIWDGNFLIDLDYSYSPCGDLPQYLHTLAFPPSYFHRVIRTSPAASPQGSNPIVHMNVGPWGEEIAANLLLLQDRMRTGIQGSRHNVVRWVHRSSFVIRPPPAPVAARYGPNRTRIAPPRIPIPGTDLFVDPGWYGTVVIEAEGTNEGLADMQERCGAVFPQRMRKPVNGKVRDSRKVFRLMREKSRPGEIWMRTVTEQERLM